MFEQVAREVSHMPIEYYLWKLTDCIGHCHFAAFLDVQVVPLHWECILEYFNLPIGCLHSWVEVLSIYEVFLLGEFAFLLLNKVLLVRDGGEALLGGYFEVREEGAFLFFYLVGRIGSAPYHLYSIYANISLRLI